MLGVVFIAQYFLSDGVAGREDKLVPVLPTDAPEVVTRGQVFAQRRDGDRLEAVVLPAIGLVEGDLVPGLEQISYGVPTLSLRVLGPRAVAGFCRRAL